MCASGHWIYWETRGTLWDNMALERSAVAPAHCDVMPQVWDDEGLRTDSFTPPENRDVDDRGREAR